MVLLAGVFELVPLLAILVLAVVLALPSGMAWGAVAWSLHHPVPASLVLLFALLVVGWVVERLVRRRQADHTPEWLVTLDALARVKNPKENDLGGRALLLARLVREGAPVPDGAVLTSRLVERIVGATAGGKGIDQIWPVLPLPARREIDSFLSRTKGKLIVRASFTEENAKHSFAGVYPAVRDIDHGDRERLLAAILAVVASGDDPVGREYRRRRATGGGVARAIVLQRQLDADVSGAVSSRGLGGRADTVTVDHARKRSPSRSLQYDLVDGSAISLSGDEAVQVPAWMHRMAVLAVTLEARLGGPVVVEFALEADQPYVLDVRRAPATERKTWLHAAPLDASLERAPTFALELRGGLALVREVLAETLGRAGATPEVKEDEVRYVDGLVYVDAEVVRRALAQLGADVLLRGGLVATLRSIARVRKLPLPAVPQVTEITANAWQELRTWHGQHLLGAARVRQDLVAREWLIKTLRRLTDGTGTAGDDARGHPALRWMLARRVREASAEAERQLSVLVQAEAELGSAVARVLARGATAWNAMLKGDRHLHATLEEIDRWHEDIGAREPLETEWRTRRLAYEKRKDTPPSPRVYRPPLPEVPSDAVAGNSIGPSGMTGRAVVPKLRGVGVVAGVAKGPAVLLSGHDRGVGLGAIVVMSDVRAEHCPQVYDAKGIVLLAGGVVSPVTLLAAELGVPVVLCPGARIYATHDVTIDGTAGTVTVHR